MLHTSGRTVDDTWYTWAKSSVLQYDGSKYWTSNGTRTGSFFAGLWLRLQAISNLPIALKECVLLVWKDALGCNFAHLCHNAKRTGVEQEYLDKDPHEILKKAFFKPLVYGDGYIATALCLPKIIHSWFTMIKLSSSPSLHSSFTASHLPCFLCHPLAATCPGSC